MKTNIELQESIEALESRNAFQDDVIEQLHTEIAIHQTQLSDLKHQLSLIAARMKEANPQQNNQQEVEPPPPHY